MSLLSSLSFSLDWISHKIPSPINACPPPPPPATSSSSSDSPFIFESHPFLLLIYLMSHPILLLFLSFFPSFNVIKEISGICSLVTYCEFIQRVPSLILFSLEAWETLFLSLVYFHWVPHFASCEMSATLLIVFSDRSLIFVHSLPYFKFTFILVFAWWRILLPTRDASE